ncbi:MAG: hypothetical protein ABIQ93_01670, partial [Saprospiraceae bacterium]
RPRLYGMKFFTDMGIISKHWKNRLNHSIHHLSTTIMESKMQSNSPEGYGRDLGFPRNTTPQEVLSQPKRMTGNNPNEINPNTETNPNEINPNTPQTGDHPNEMNPNTPHRENTPNEINPNTPQTGNNPNEINPNTPQTGNDPNEMNPTPQTAGYANDTRQESDLQLPENATGKKEEGYAETPTAEYIPEINGNEKYQPNYQDNEGPPVVTE